MIDPIPSRDARRPAGRDARAARDHRDAFAACSTRAATARWPRPRSSTRTCCARGDAAAAEPAYRLFDEQGNVLVLRSDMTIPIARVVATRYATSEPPLRFCYFAARLPQPCGRSAGRRARCSRRASSWSARPGRRGRPRRSSVLCEVLDAAGLRRLPDRARRRLAVPARCSTRSGCPTRRAAALLHELVTRDFVGLEREVEALRLAGGAARRCCAMPQLRGGASVLDVDGRRPRRSGGCATLHERLTPARGRAGDLRPRAVALARLLHGRGLRGLRRRARRRRWAAAGATTTCSARFGRDAAGLRLGAERRAAAHRAASARSAASDGARTGCTIAVPRGALMRRHARPARHARRRHRRGARQRPQAAVRATSGSSRCGRPTCRPTSRRAPPTSASPARTCSPSRPSARSTSCSTSASGAAGWCSRPSPGDDPAAEALRRLGVMRDRDQVPAHRRRATSSAPAARRRSSRSRARSSWRR